jgi:uncharacterized membrane protein YuzA (DUF378 family)
MEILEKIAMVLAAIGAINWGLVAVRSFSAIDYSLDIVAMLLGNVAWLAAIVYLLVAISGVWVLIKAFQ